MIKLSLFLIPRLHPIQHALPTYSFHICVCVRVYNFCYIFAIYTIYVLQRQIRVIYKMLHSHIKSNVIIIFFFKFLLIFKKIYDCSKSSFSSNTAILHCNKQIFTFELRGNSFFFFNQSLKCILKVFKLPSIFIFIFSFFYYQNFNKCIN